ncbi:acylase [Micromonospora sp. DR5-3]|uniref:acylase n=1 Tax=unclassified Micromonospora TaxID=2617518 RepID=UPI0011DA3F5A|nr:MULTISPECIES: acylase [unclassified Micromonospora]MCW3815899.1 acylase [Micromonospora sp. DR5-3]TYC24409.1 acylase [Micromonospora sp. MP36]
MRPRRIAAATTAVVLVAAGLTATTSAAAAHGSGYSALIQRASYGVPHITARDFASLGYGVGHVQAEDNICTIAETVVTVRAQRSRWFGTSGDAAVNVTSDLFQQKVIDDRVVERLLIGPRDGLHTPSNEVRDQIRGFVAGYNAYLRRTGAANLTDPACAGKPWVQPITELDVWRAHWTSMARAGSAGLADGIIAAAPPGKGAPTQPGEITGQLPAPEAAALVAARDGAPAGVGSNAYALGRDATASGSGMLLANPHFPWDGPDRFYRMHLKIPGSYDVEGAALVGDPLIEIGHNGRVAWSHTVSTARRFTWHKLTLGPGDPTTYLHDGKPRKMTARTVTVQTPDGPVSRTLYDTHFGPVVVVPGRFDWTADTAYAISDPNAANNRALDGWLAMGRARSVADLRAVLDRRQFLPWVNVIAADSGGNALYADHSVIPRVTDDLAATCIPAAYRNLYAGSGQAVLDGSRSACELGRDPDAAVPGILGPAHLPTLVRNDYVTNSNDSYWLANPQQPLEGFPRIIGNERTERSLRTRLGVHQVRQRLASTDGLPGTRFTTGNLWAVTLGNRAYGGELVRDDLVKSCTANPAATASDGTRVDLTAACAALRGWDLRVDLDSRGSHVFTEFARAGGLRFADRFDPANPLTTPSRLAVDDPWIRTALADAVQLLDGIPLNARLGDIQTEPRGADRIPIHGGWPEAGVFNMTINVVQPGVGYPKVLHGTSFLMAVELGPNGPSGRQILTYSQSANPNSPWYADQTRLYSGKGFDTIKFTERQLKADPNLVTYRVGERHG